MPTIWWRRAHWVVDELGGTPYVTTSRRTTPEVVEVLRRDLPEQAVFYAWSPEADAQDNPYRALLGCADGFIVTADSVSMMVEVIYLHKPLAIFPLPGGWLGSIDQRRRSLGPLAVQSETGFHMGSMASSLSEGGLLCGYL